MSRTSKMASKNKMAYPRHDAIGVTQMFSKMILVYHQQRLFGDKKTEFVFVERPYYCNDKFLRVSECEKTVVTSRCRKEVVLLSRFLFVASHFQSGRGVGQRPDISLSSCRFHGNIRRYSLLNNNMRCSYLFQKIV